MKKQRFKVGDVVRLKSGGPRMTVSGVSIPVKGEAPFVVAEWFPRGSYGEHPLHSSFQPDMLEADK